LEQLKKKPRNIFNKKSIENEIRDYEYKHFHQLNKYIDALIVLPEGKITPKKWQAEVDELKKILDDNPVESIKDRLRKSKGKANELNRERKLLQPERKKKTHEAEIQ
jgi:hypothetical protein